MLSLNMHPKGVVMYCQTLHLHRYYICSKYILNSGTEKVSLLIQILYAKIIMLPDLFYTIAMLSFCDPMNSYYIRFQWSNKDGKSKITAGEYSKKDNFLMKFYLSK